MRLRRAAAPPLHADLHLSRQLLHHTSPLRLFQTRGFTQALRCVLRLSPCLPALRATHKAAEDALVAAETRANLRQARFHAARKAGEIPVAHDVFALLTGRLGGDSRPHHVVREHDGARRRFVRVRSGMPRVGEQDGGEGRRFGKSASVGGRVGTEQRRRFGKAVSFGGCAGGGVFDCGETVVEVEVAVEGDGEGGSSESDGSDVLRKVAPSCTQMARVKSVRFEGLGGVEGDGRRMSRVRSSVGELFDRCGMGELDV